MDTHTLVDNDNVARSNDAVLTEEGTPSSHLAVHEDPKVQTVNESLNEECIRVNKCNDKKLFKTQKQTALALFAKLLACFPGFTNPQRDDVIIANQLLNYGVADIQQEDIPIAKEAMDSAKSFYNQYARLLGFGLGAAVSVCVEWVQSVYPDFQGIRVAHVGSGVIAGWVVSNIMSEYERRIHQLKEKLR
jgi:formylmethanofuran dehydrogenase subunit E-like metal-binding protein